MLALAAPAAQAETFKTTFGPGRENVFNWEGMSTGIASIPLVIRNGCGDVDPFFRCDKVIYNMESEGTLEVTVTPDGTGFEDPTGNASYPDLDLYLFASNASGAHPEDAEPVAESAGATLVETFKVKLKKGYYVLEVEPYQGQDITYKGESKGTEFAVVEAPAAEPPAPVSPTPEAPAPQQQPAQPTQSESKPTRTGKRAACQKKARKKFKKNAKKRKAALKKCRRKPV